MADRASPFIRPGRNEFSLLLSEDADPDIAASSISSTGRVQNLHMRLALIILAHRAPDQMRLLLRTLRHDQVALYLHVDSRVSLKPVIETGVTPLPRFPTRWGGPEIIDAILAGLTCALADGCDYVALITGHGFPLKPISEIVDFFAATPDRSYGQYWPISDRERTDFYSYTVRGRREVCIPWGEDTSSFGPKGHALNWLLRLRSLPKGKRRFPPYLQPFGGRVWWNLSREATQYVLQFLKDHPDYRPYHEHMRCPDEVFFCSILAQSGLDIVNDSLRYYTWGEGGRSLTAGTQQITAMLGSGALFAQKVDEAASQELAVRFEAPDGLNAIDRRL